MDDDLRDAHDLGDLADFEAGPAAPGPAGTALPGADLPEASPTSLRPGAALAPTAVTTRRDPDAGRVAALADALSDAAAGALAPALPATSLAPAVVPFGRPEPDTMAGPTAQRLSDVDEWGRSERLRARARLAFEPIYRYWFRVEWEGLEKIPRSGGALLVANHAGAIPSDAPVIMHGIETELHRPVYGLADHLFRGVPVVGTLWSRVGGVVAHPDNAYRLLREQERLVLVFPEGAKGPAKHYDERYRLRRFGRGGFAEIAMRTGVPIVPIAVVGAEESMPILADVPMLAKLFKLPYFPITANMLLLGPMGALVWLPAKFRVRVLDPVVLDVAPDQPRYSRSRIMDTAEDIRQRIQEALFEMLRTRASPWFG